MTHCKPLITDEQSLIGAKRNDYDIPVYDDGYGTLFVHRNSIGISGIVRASTWEDAYSICEDEFFPDADESLEEIIKEYGENWSEDACWNEQYGFRPNGASSNDKRHSSVYVKDLNGDSLDVLTPELAAEFEITLQIEDNE